jgi:hypothetical protein
LIRIVLEIYFEREKIKRGTLVEEFLYINFFIKSFFFAEPGHRISRINRIFQDSPKGLPDEDT